MSDAVMVPRAWLLKVVDTLKPFAEVAEKLRHCHVVEICEPHPDNPSPNIAVMPREWLERAGDDLEAAVIALHRDGALSEGQAAKLTGLDRVEVRKLSDALAASTPVGGWEDISTHDGSREPVLLWFPDFAPQGVVIGFYKAQAPDCYYPGQWVDDLNNEPFEVGKGEVFPTHWMSLPPPPSVSTDKGPRPQEAVPTEGHDTEILALRTALKALLTACYSADAGDGLSDEIDGSLLDAGEAALDLQFPVVWTDEQVAMLEARQADPMAHPYTCGGNRSDALHKAQAEEDGDHDTGVLIPTVRGWICPACDYRQFWSHETGRPTPQPADGCSSNEGADGWIEWSGGENPAPGRRVDVRLRGFENPPEFSDWASEHWSWPHEGNHGDIIAYRILPQTEKGL